MSVRPAGLDDLHRSLSARFDDGASEMQEGTIVALPSITFPEAELRKIVAIERYEERLLFLVLLLERPKLELVYVTSLPVPAAAVDYYLSFTPDPEDARRRLHLFALDDPEPRALSAKLLERPEVLDALAATIADPDAAYLLPFNVTPAEAEIAERLGVPLYGPRPDLVVLGSKSGSRRVARAAGVPILDGAEDIYSLAELERELEALHRRRPGMSAAVVKLNDGFSGQGNAIVRLDGYHIPIESSDTIFCAPTESWSSFRTKIESEGCIVEELMRRPGVVSPSVQLRILPNGDPELLSTHDQILGDPDGQVYLGCRFPARREYRGSISEAAMRVARVLAEEGVIGSFGIDFVLAPIDGSYEPFLSEINLRMGGTTHTFLMTRYASGGTYDPESGDLLVGGRRTCYVATDNLRSPGYAQLDPAQVIDALRSEGLAYDRAEHHGILLHLLGALPGYGKLGAVCVATSMPEAERLYEELLALLDELTWS
jgi:hypothetical protein